MKKLTTLLIVLVLLFLLTPNNVSAANSITNRLKGRLLLQVEQGGAIWYVNPIDLQKYQVTWANALPLFQSFALGITDSDLVKIPADVNSIRPDLDSDNDGYTDISELNNGFSPYIPGAYKGKFSIDKNLANRLKGRLLLQVQQGGAIWYVDHTGVRHNVRWDNLMNLFTRLALGITDADLAKVGVIDTTDWQTYRNSEYGYEYKCPAGWELHQNVDYGGDVDLSVCSKIYSGKHAFDDGVSVSFGFVPLSVAENYYSAGKKWSETLMDNVKSQPNATKYLNNSFDGWISLKHSGHTLILLARRQVNGGYYEVSVSAVGDTKTDKEYKVIVDQIISTFKLLD